MKNKLFFLIIGIGLILIIVGIISMNKSGLIFENLGKNNKEGIVLASDVELIEDNKITGGIILSPDLFVGWTYYMEGNESVLYDVKSLKNKQICIIPKDKDMKDIIQKELDLTKPILSKDGLGEMTYELKDVTYKYPKDIKMYDISKDVKTELKTKDLTKDKEIDNSICFDINPLVSLFYRLGEESITLSGETTYNSTNTNVTNENKFSHLNLTDGSLVLYMPFDVIEDSANKTYDYSNYSNDGVLGNGNISRFPTFTSAGGVYGGDYQFDGVNDYIDLGGYNNIPLNGYPTNNFTISAWIKIGSIPAGIYTRILGKVGTQVDFEVYLGRLGARVYNTTNQYVSFRGNTVLNLNQWYFATMVYNGSTVELFLNGLSDGSQPFSGPISYPHYGYMIGAYYFGVNDYGKKFNGSIDEVMVFNRSLSGTEVAQIYNSTYSRFYPVGEMNFTSNNFGTNNTVNITIPNCWQLNGSLINFKVNDGSYSQLNSSCMFDNYNMTGDLTSANVILQLNSTNNYFYSPVINGNITLNSWLVSSANSCTYSSGNWNINCSQYCNITSNVDVLGNNISIIGVGTVTVSANVSNYNKLHIEGLSSTNICRVRCINGGCFKN